MTSQVAFSIWSSRQQTPWMQLTRSNVGLVLPFNKPLQALAPRLRYKTIPVKLCVGTENNQLVWICYLLNDLGTVRACQAEVSCTVDCIVFFPQ